MSLRALFAGAVGFSNSFTTSQLLRLAMAIRLAALSMAVGGVLPATAQAQSCGGLNQQACCIDIFHPTPACQANLREEALGEYPTACVIGAGTCVPIAPMTACGGEGQRGCCAFEGGTLHVDACDADLTLIFDLWIADGLHEAVSGDATCGGVSITNSSTPRSTGTCVRHDPFHPPTSDIAEPGTGWKAGTGTEPRGEMRGYLDMHLHLFGNMAHGGKNLAGKPAPLDDNGMFVLDDTHNINNALSAVDDLAIHGHPWHGLVFDTSGDGTQDGARAPYGAPYFNGWPKWNSTTHQQTYYVWLERAWRGGLRMTTLLTSHVESLCKSTFTVAEWPEQCEDSMKHIVEQLRAARDFKRFVDDQSGGEDLGWFRIVTTPSEARDAIQEGKLAVVLGIEVDNLFNCKEQTCPADFGLATDRLDGLTDLTSPTTVEEAVNVIYDMGVRHVFPVHNFDNGFGAAATWMDVIGVGQAAAEQRWWEVRDCGTGTGPDEYGFWIDRVLSGALALAGFAGHIPVIPDDYYPSGIFDPEYASCNTRGLLAARDGEEKPEQKPGGARLIRALMNKGMLIDIDHMSVLSLDDTLALAKTTPGSDDEPYPLVASHVQSFDLHDREFRDNKGRHERMRTRAQLEAIKATGGMIAAMLKDDVQDTDLKGEKYTLQYTPSVGAQIDNDCRHSSKTWAQALQYAVDVMGGPVAMGSDFNGQAGHLGPRFGSDACGGWGEGEPYEKERRLQEEANNRVGYNFTLPGFGEFEKQVTGFKTFDYNVDGLAHIGLLPDLMADLPRIGVNQYYVDQVFCSAEAYVRVWERAEALAAGNKPPDPDRAWRCNALVTDNTPPTVTVPRDITKEATGSDGASVTFVASADDNETPGLTPTCTQESGFTFPLGSTTVTCRATDGGGLEGSASFTVNVRDTTPPNITCAAKDGVWHAANVSIACEASDIVGLADPADTPFSLTTSIAAGVETAAAFTTSRDICDAAGNCATAPAIGDIKVDRKAPFAPCGRSDGLWHPADVNIDCFATDGGSGLANPADALFTLATSVPTGSETANAITGSRTVCDSTMNCANAGPVGGNKVDKKAPAVSCGVSDGVWHPADVNIGCLATDGGSGLVNAADASFALATSVPAGSETANALTGSRTVCDSTDNCASAGPVGGNKVDKKAPAVSCGASDGVWHPADVNIGCLATDGGSGLVNAADASFALATSVPVGSETASALTGSRIVCDSTKNCASAGPVGGNKVDKKAPSVLVSLTPPANANGWNNTDVVATFVATDGGSGVNGVATLTVSFTAEGANQSATRSFTDNVGNASASTAIVNIDKTPPTLTCSNNGATLWPPDHKLVTVTAAVKVDGGLSGASGFTLRSATSNEPDNGLGDGDTDNDIQGWALATPDTIGMFRAERSGKGTGRIYTLTYQGFDLAGNSGVCTTRVSVVHDNGGKK